MPKTFNQTCQGKFDNRKGNIEEQGQDNNRPNVQVPISRYILVLALNQKPELTQEAWLLIVLSVDENDDETHIHYEQKCSFDGVAIQLICYQFMSFKNGEQFEQILHCHVVDHQQERYHYWNSQICCVLESIITASVILRVEVEEVGLAEAVEVVLIC